jgi:23S rRNA (guanosine2251-2'-O)-methyltransferase
MSDQLEGRNPVIECLRRKKRRIYRIWLDQGAKEDGKVRELLTLAEKAGVPLNRVPRKRLDEQSHGRVHNGVIAAVEPLKSLTTLQLIDDLFESGQDAFLILADEIAYEQNLGAILRSALGFGVNGMIIPSRRGATFSSVAQRIAMGAAEEIPVVHDSLTSALKHIRKAGIRVIGADMNGTSLSQLDLRGPIALMLGGEGKGLSSTLQKRCDAVVSIPLQGELESLNVSVAAGVLMYEKRRQEGE